MKTVKGKRAETCIHAVILWLALFVVGLAIIFAVLGIWMESDKFSETSFLSFVVGLIALCASGLAWGISHEEPVSCRSRIRLPWRAPIED